MTITLELTPGMEAALTEAAARQGIEPEGLTEQEKMEALIAGLKDRPVPQTLAELKPRRLPPPGKTAMDMIVGQWPGDETDAELQAALKAMG